MQVVQNQEQLLSPFDLPTGKNSYGLIYCTTNLVNGKKYIGKMAYGKYKDGRIKDWKVNYLGSSPILWRAIEKYGKTNFIRETLQYCINADDINESEIYWSEYFGAVKSDLFYNIIPAGTGGYLGEEAGKKIGKANKRRVSEPNWTGFKMGIGSKPYADRISKAKKGKPFFAKRKRVGRFDLDGNLLQEYGAATLAVMDGYCHSKISACCRGKRNKHKGFIWKFL